MTKPLVIIINGPPAAGKTTLGRQLATELDWPFLCKDGVKEMLFDGIDGADREWAERLSPPTWDLTMHCSELLMQGRCSFVLEGDFSREWHEERLQGWSAQYGHSFFQIRCSANVDVLYTRYVARIESGERHAGHVNRSMDRITYGVTHAPDAFPPLDLGGTFVEIDTTDFATVDFDALLQGVRMEVSDG